MRGGVVNVSVRSETLIRVQIPANTVHLFPMNDGAHGE